MPDVRKKMAELLGNLFCGDYGVNGCDSCKYNTEVMCSAHACADHLITNGVTIQRWIPVEERLPEDDGEYLALGNYFGWWHAVLMFAKDGRKVDEYDFHERWENVWYDFDRDYGHCIYGSVTHWMPLPEPPKEE